MNRLAGTWKRAEVMLGSERTEDEVTAELHRLNTRVEHIHQLSSQFSREVRQICPDLAKKTEKDSEKFFKKLPEEMLSHVLKTKGCDITNEFPDVSQLAEVALESARLEHQLAKCKLDLYDTIQKNVLSPMENITNDDYNAKKVNMKHLKSLAFEVDVAKKEEKDSQSQFDKFEKRPGKAGEDVTQKLAELKEKAAQAENQVEIKTSTMEQTKDAVATSLLNFVCKEHEISDIILQLLAAQQDYHEKCAQHIKDILPGLRHKTDSFQYKKMYGVPLSSHLESTGKEVAVPIEECCSIIYFTGIKEEGLLRIPGSAAKIKRVVAALNYPGLVDWDYFGNDLHSIGGAMKQYLRDLPEPLLTFGLYSRWMGAAREIQAEADVQLKKPKNLEKLRQIVQQLPSHNFAQLRYLNAFFAEMAEHSEENKMTPANIGIVMGANLLWPERADASALADAHVKNFLVELLISNHDKFFPGVRFRPTRPLSFNLTYSSSFHSSSSFSSVAAASSPDVATTPTITPGHVGMNFARAADSAGSSDSLDGILDEDESTGKLRLPRKQRPDRKSLRGPPPPPPSTSSFRGDGSGRRNSPNLQTPSSDAALSRSLSPLTVPTPTTTTKMRSVSPARPPALPVKLRTGSTPEEPSKTSWENNNNSNISSLSNMSDDSKNRKAPRPEELSIVITRAFSDKEVRGNNNNNEDDGDYEEIAEPPEELTIKKPAVTSPKPKLGKEYWPLNEKSKVDNGNSKDDNNNDGRSVSIAPSASLKMKGVTTATTPSVTIDINKNNNSNNNSSNHNSPTARPGLSAPVRPDSLPPLPPVSQNSGQHPATKNSDNNNNNKSTTTNLTERTKSVRQTPVTPTPPPKPAPLTAEPPLLSNLNNSCSNSSNSQISQGAAAASVPSNPVYTQVFPTTPKDTQH